MELVGELCDTNGVGVGETHSNDRPKNTTLKTSSLNHTIKSMPTNEKRLSERTKSEQRTNVSSTSTTTSSSTRASPYTLPLIKPIPITLIPAPTDRIAVMLFRQQVDIQEKWQQLADLRVNKLTIRSQLHTLIRECESRRNVILKLMSELDGLGEVMSEEQYAQLIAFNTLKHDYRDMHHGIEPLQQQLASMDMQYTSLEMELAQQFITWHAANFISTNNQTKIDLNESN